MVSDRYIEKIEAENATLRAERDALLPLARFVAHLVESRLETRQSFDRTCFAENEVELAVEYLGLKEDHLAAARATIDRESSDA